MTIMIKTWICLRLGHHYVQEQNKLLLFFDMMISKPQSFLFFIDIVIVTSRSASKLIKKIVFSNALLSFVRASSDNQSIATTCPSSLVCVCSHSQANVSKASASICFLQHCKQVFLSSPKLASLSVRPHVSHVTEA